MRGLPAPRLAPPAPLTRGQGYAFAVGEFGANLSWNMISGFILFYYSNVALLPVAAVGTLLLVTRILDAAIDPLIGVMVDKTRTRFGRARPYLLFAAVPLAILTVMTFSVPAWSVGAKLIYAYVTFTLVGLIYSAVYVPYNALAPLMTSAPGDKLRLGALRAVAASAGSIAVYALMTPLVAKLGAGNAQRGFTLASAVMATGTALAVLFVFETARERAHLARPIATEPVLHGVRDMLRNPVWLIVSGFALAMFLRLGSLVSVTAYFAADVLRRPEAIPLLLSSLSFSLLIGGGLAKPFLARFGKRAGNIIALAAAVMLTGVEFLVRSDGRLFAVVYGLANVTLGVQSATIFTLMADSVDVQERRFGRRNEGLLSSSVSFAMKVGMAMGGAIAAYGLAAGGYRPQAVTQGARDMITALYFGAPTAFALAQLVLISFYGAPRDEPASADPSPDAQERA